MSNCSDFTLKKEDHTIGNLITEHLKQSPNVLMAAYKGGINKPETIMEMAEADNLCAAVPHPNVPELFIRVQTDGTITPKEAVIRVCKDLITLYGQLGQAFTREYELRRMVAAGEQDGHQPHGGGL